MLASAGHAAPLTVDLGFIMDESGSVGQTNYTSSINALRNALSQIPLATDDVVYRVGVVSFGASAAVVAAPTVFNTAADRNAVLAALSTEAASGYGAPGGITNSTNYSAAFTLINSSFGTLGDLSILNMATDGQNNAGGTSTQVTTRANDLRTAGWDALSFEAIGSTSNSDEAFLASIGFDSSGQGGCDIIDTAAGIVDVVDNCFVIDIPSFAAYEAAVLTKVRKTVVDTGGDPDDLNAVPLPAGLPLLLAGLGAFGVLRRRK